VLLLMQLAAAGLLQHAAATGGAFDCTAMPPFPPLTSASSTLDLPLLWLPTTATWGRASLKSRVTCSTHGQEVLALLCTAAVHGELATRQLLLRLLRPCMHC
jgi:hypothetical protein